MPRALVAHLNVEGQHRGAVAAARAAQSPPPAHKEGHGHGPGAGKVGHGHDHAAGNGHKHADGHKHAHSDVDGHDHHAHEAGETKRAKVAGDEHGCEEDHKHDEGCGHGHAHGHDHKHGHGHSHAAADRQETTAATQYGIRSFVYARRRPFHSTRCGCPAGRQAFGSCLTCEPVTVPVAASLAPGSTLISS